MGNLNEAVAVVFLSSNPAKLSNINSEKEKEVIKQALSSPRFHFFDETGKDLSNIEELITDIENKELPLQLLHISDQDSSFNKLGNGSINYTQIVEYFQDAHIQLQCVIVNACDSLSSLEVFRPLSEQLILFHALIPTSLTTFFSEKFYSKINRGIKIPIAYKSTCRELRRAIKNGNFIDPQTKQPFSYQDDLLPILQKGQTGKDQGMKEGFPNSVKKDSESGESKRWEGVSPSSDAESTELWHHKTSSEQRKYFQELIASNQMQQCIYEVKSLIEEQGNNRLLLAIIKASQDLEQMEEDSLAGILDREQKSLSRARITKSLLRIVDKSITYNAKQTISHEKEFIPFLHSEEQEEKSEIHSLDLKEKENAFKGLLRLNFEKQLDSIHETTFGKKHICLIHGQQEHAQAWLLRILLELYREAKIADQKPFKHSEIVPIKSGKWVKKDVFQENLIRKFKLRPKDEKIESFRDALQQKILGVLRTESFIVTIINPTQINEEIFAEFIQQVWAPILRTPQVQNSKHSLLLFLIEAEQVLTEEASIIQSIPKDLLNFLPSNECFEYKDYHKWVTSSARINPWVNREFSNKRTKEDFEQSVQEARAEASNQAKDGGVMAIPDRFLFQLFEEYIDYCPIQI